VNLWLVAVIVVVAATAAVGVMYLVRSRSKSDHFFIEIERGAGIFAFLGTAFAVILAFVVLAAFQSFNDAKAGAEEEATAIAALVVSGLLLVWFLDHPYENRSGSIKPDEMERQLVIVKAEHRGVAPPCDEDGQPAAAPA
jgi:hypothetical protein